MRILVTGIGGFVGSHVAEELLVTDLTTRVVGVESFRHNGTVDRALSAVGKFHERCLNLMHDLRAPFSLAQLSDLRSGGNIDVIINVASRCHVGESIAEPVEFIRNNVDLILNALELSRELRPKHFIQMSTDEVYGPYTPGTSDDHRPSNPYSASKAAQEDVCHAYRRTYGVPITIVSSANMFGERQSQLAFIPRVIRAILRGETVQIHALGEVPGSRRYSYVRNVTREIVKLALATESEVKYPRVILPGQHEISNLELAMKIADLLERPLRYELVDAERVRPGYDVSYGDFSAYGRWVPEISFDEGLKRTVRWFSENTDALA